MDQQTLTEVEAQNGVNGSDSKSAGRPARVGRTRGDGATDGGPDTSGVPERSADNARSESSGVGSTDVQRTESGSPNVVGGSSDPSLPPRTEGPTGDGVEKTSAEPIRRGIIAVISNEQKYLQASDIDGRIRLAQYFFRSGMVPKGYKDAGSVFAGMELALELGLKPLSALRNISVINGTPNLWGDLPLALVRRAALLEKFEEFFLDKDYNEISWKNKNLHHQAYAAVCITRRKGSDRDKETVFTMDDAKTAGLLSKESPWKTYPKRMMQFRSRTQNLRDNFGDVLYGLEIAEYDWNFIPSRDVTPDGRVTREGTVERDNAAELNKTLGH